MKKNLNFVKGEKLDDAEEFYKSYFWEASERKKMSLDDYILPGCKLYKLKKKTQKNKNLIKTYLKRIFEVDQFKEDFCNFLENHFLKGYSKTRLKKIILITEKYQRQHSFNKLKIPWTDEDVCTSKTRILKMINRF